MSRIYVVVVGLLFLQPITAHAIETHSDHLHRDKCHKTVERLGVVIETDCFGRSQIKPVIVSRSTRTLSSPIAMTRHSFNNDRDLDGVILPLDDCRHSRRHRAVDEHGCQDFYFYTLAEVYFEFDKARLTNRGLSTLNQAIIEILGNPNITRVVVRGHADWKGSFKYNDKLSDQRVAKVQDYLHQNGVPQKWLFPQGMGEHFPIDENWTRLGRVRNRHVELLVFELE